MSKRARITLQPAIDAESGRDSQAAGAPETPIIPGDSVATAPARPSSEITRKTTGAGRVARAAFVGLVAASLALLWKHRRTLRLLRP